MDKPYTFKTRGLKSTSSHPNMSSISSNMSYHSSCREKSKIPVAAMTGHNVAEKEMTPFLEEDGLSDVILIVEGKRLYTSKALLSMCSPVFSRLLLSSSPAAVAEEPCEKDDDVTKEKILADDRKRELQLPGKQFDNVHELLYVLHPAYQRKITDQSAFIILPLAEEYEIWNLKQKCEETLLNSFSADKVMREEVLMKCLNMADEFKLFALWSKCLQLCSKSSLSLQSLKRCTEYENLSKFLKSMLEAFKGSGENTYKTQNSLDLSGSSNSRQDISGRGRSPVIVNETLNAKKTVSHSKTQTVY